MPADVLRRIGQAHRRWNAGGCAGRFAIVGAVIRRSVLASLPVVAALALSSCSTFSRNDAVATVDGRQLSRSELSELLSNSVIQNQLTGALDGDRASLSGQADQIIGIWISLQVVHKNGLADLSGAAEQTQLTTQYKDAFTGASPTVQQVLTQLEAYHNQVGGLDGAALYAAVKKANIHVDSRYGYWDAEKVSVLPFGEAT